MLGYDFGWHGAVNGGVLAVDSFPFAVSVEVYFRVVGQPNLEFFHVGMQHVNVGFREIGAEEFGDEWGSWVVDDTIDFFRRLLHFKVVGRNGGCSATHHGGNSSDDSNFFH